MTEVIALSKRLGDPSLDLVILGEGNTSARADDHSFWVKASGTQLATADRNTFVRVAMQPVLDALKQPELSDEQIRDVLREATLEGQRAPSIETFLHALCLQTADVHFVAHTHPTPALSLLCSRKSRELFTGSLFPDQIVLLGPAPVYVPYADPGLPLAQSVHRHLNRYLDQRGRTPRVILLENHGVIALGGTATEALNVTLMLVKTCRILAGTLVGDGPRFLSVGQAARIDTRPDEQERRRWLRS